MFIITVRLAEKVAEANLSLPELDIKKEDEIGQLTSNFNKMVNNLRGILSDVLQSTSHIASTSEQLSINSKEVTDFVENNTNHIQGVKEGSDKQVRSASHVKEIVSRISKDTTFNISSWVENAAKNSEAAANRSKSGDKAMNKVTAQIKIINSRSEFLSSRMESLQGKTDKINDILSIITGIADQTNLLALNAAI